MPMDLNRRAFLLGSSSAVSLSLLPFEGWAISADTAKDPAPPAPVARIEVVKDTYFGETLTRSLPLDGKRARTPTGCRS